MNLENLKKEIKEKLGVNPITSKEIQNVEKNLSIELPKLFKELNAICSYEYSNWGSFLNFGSNSNESVISATSGIRERYPNLNQDIVLYLDDAGIVLMNTTSDDGRVTWCSIYDLENYINKGEMQYGYDFFPTFPDFFKYLLDEEEKSRAEDEVSK